MAITAGTVLGHYKIIALLGAGGMGEVYKAEDTTLGRPVALKILPAHLVEDADRVRRFVQEAKSASALNHPHIVTIYEIGQINDGNDSAGTSAEGERVLHYIAMEFVDGETLHKKIHRDKTELKKLLEYFAQASDGLAKAHSAGIVHRDLKPDNIMITSDGYAKILDFGLAKLVEPKEPAGRPAAAADIEEAATAMMGQTRPGMVMGTIGYMSPEQALGKVIDQRSDIFSFGCILYEAATGANPFSGQSVIDALHKIVYAPAPLIGETNPNAPAELQRIIRKCLAKDPGDRYQSIRDISIDLRDLTRDYDTQPRASGTHSYNAVTGVHAQATDSGPQAQNVLTQTHSPTLITDPQQPLSTGPVPAIQTKPVGKLTRWLLIAGAALLLIGIAIIFLVPHKQSRGRTGPLFQNTSISKLTSTGKSTGALISPDGKYVVYIMNDAGQRSLWVRQVATSSNLQVIPPAEIAYVGLTFSPDGNYVYYVKAEKGNPIRSLFQVPVLGGTPKQVLQDVDSSITFSPDGKRFAFMRNYVKESETAIIVVNADGVDEQKLAVRKQPNMYFEPVWSPDGKIIACSARTVTGGFHFEVVAIQVADGSEKTVGTQGWGILTGLAWLADSSGLVVSGRDQTPGSYQIQIWQVPYPEGKPRRITSDLNNYAGISLTGDSSAIATVQADAVSNIWVVPDADAARASQITSGSGKYAYISWAPDGRIVYVTDASGNFDIWVMNADGSNQKQLTSDAGINVWPIVSSDGRHIVFCSNRGGGVSTLNIWRMGMDGSNPKQLTKGDGEFWPALSPDGKWVFYTPLGSSTKPKLHKVSIDGGDPVQVIDKVSLQGLVSPDQKYIACWYSDESGTSPAKLALFPFEGSAEPVKTFSVPPAIGEMVTIQWTSDGKAITYLDSQRGITNIWSQPIDGSAPKQLTTFKGEEIFGYGWSKDGKQLACARGTQKTDVILIKSQSQSER